MCVSGMGQQGGGSPGSGGGNGQDIWNEELGGCMVAAPDRPWRR